MILILGMVCGWMAIFAVGLLCVCCVNEEQVAGWLYLYPASPPSH